jgi:hypothetical protein
MEKTQFNGVEKHVSKQKRLALNTTDGVRRLILEQLHPYESCEEYKIIKDKLHLISDCMIDVDGTKIPYSRGDYPQKDLFFPFGIGNNTNSVGVSFGTTLIGINFVNPPLTDIETEALNNLTWIISIKAWPPI